MLTHFIRIAISYSVALLPLVANPEWEALEKSSRWKALRAQVNSRLSTNPKDGEALHWKAKVLMAFGKAEESYMAAKESVKLSPQSAEAWAQLSASAGVMANRASVLKKMSFGTECRDSGIKALGLDPKNRVALEVMANFYQHAPGVLGGDKKKAESHRIALETIFPEIKTTNELREARRSRDKTRINSLLKKAMEQYPKAHWPFVNAAQNALDRSTLNPQMAQVYAKQALENDQFSARAWGYLAQAYAAEGKWTDFDATITKAETILTDNAHPHYLAATWLISASKEPKKAEALLRRYLSMEPEAGAPGHAQARWRLALALEQQGDKVNALKELREAAKHLPKNTELSADLKRLGG
ncbi:MAG: tetratricopeptide repeat protein [Holophagaceae bacterium]|nr:tetratricopeptide repeat protein [Holophagaceae bacterium]